MANPNLGLGHNLGSDMLISPGDLTLNTATAPCELGARATTSDGRAFRLVLAGGTALVSGKLQSAAAETTAWQDLDVAAGSVGDTSITTTSTVTVTANQLSQGYVVVTNGTGQGLSYQISSHAAATGAVVTLNLSDSVQVAFPNTVDVDLIMSPYSKVVLWATSQVAAVVGVAVYPITAAQYGWIQVSGPCACLVDAGNLTVGQMAVASDDTDGAVGPFESDALAFPVVGTALTGISSGEYGMVNLNIS